MNFEQNFSALDPNSEEYQSINEIDNQEKEKTPGSGVKAPAKKPTIKGTSIPVTQPGLSVPVVEEKPYAQLESVIKSFKTVNSDYQNMVAAKGGASSAYGVGASNDDINRQLEMSNFLKRQQDDLLKKYSKDINLPIERVVSSKDWNTYFTQGGAFDEKKAINYINKVVSENGGGDAVKNMMLAKLEGALRNKKDQEEVKPFLVDELKKNNVPLTKDGNIDFTSIIGEENIKTGQLNKLKMTFPKQFDKLQLIENDSSKQINDLFNTAKNTVQSEEAKIALLKDSLEAQIKSGQISQEDAQKSLEDAVSGLQSLSQTLNEQFQSQARTIRIKTAEKYKRIQKEINASSKDISFDDIVSSLPKNLQESVRAKLDNIKSVSDAAYNNAYKKLYNSRNEQKKKEELKYGYEGLAAKSFISGWKNGLASIGGYLSMSGTDNKFTDWLRAHSTTGEETAPAQYEWNGSEWMKRAISSSMQSTGASLPIIAPTVAAAAVGTLARVPSSGIALLNGITGYLGERAQNEYDVYDKELLKSGNPAEALSKAKAYQIASAYELPFHLISGLAEVKLFQLGANVAKGAGGVKSIVTEFGKGFAGELAEEYPVELIGNYNQEKLDGYKGNIFDYATSHPELLADTMVSTVGQSTLFAGAGKVFGAFTKTAPESRIQFYTNLIQRNGVEFTKTLAKKYYDAGILDGNTAKSVLGEIDKVNEITNSLKESGLDDEAAKLYIALHYQAEGLKNSSVKGGAMQIMTNAVLANTERQMKDLANGTLPYVVMSLPGGENSTRVVSLDQFKALSKQERDSVIQASNDIKVVNNDEENTKLQEQKQQLGNTPGAPEGMFTNNIKPIQNATQESARQEQISTEQGGISQYQGTQPVQEQTTNETKDSNRLISGTKKVVTLQNIDEIDQIEGNDTQKKVLGDVKNVTSSISGLVQADTGNELKVNIHDQDSFTQAVLDAGGTQQDAKSKGFYMSSDGNIHLNMDNVSEDTMLHEGFHPVLDYIEKNSPDTMNSLFEQLKSIPQAQDFVQRAEAAYGENGDITVKKEAITDFIANVANGNVKIDASNLETLKNYIIGLLNKLGLNLNQDRILDLKTAEDLKGLATFITEKFTTGEEISISDIDTYIDTVESSIPSDGIDIEFDINNGSGRKIQFSKASDTINAAKANIKPISDLVGTKVSRVVFYDNTRVGPLSIKNRITGYTPKVEGKGGFFYSYMPESIANQAVLAFTSLTQAMNSLKRQMMYPDSVHGIAMQNQDTAHLGNKSTLKALFGEKIGIFQKAASTKAQEKEILDTLKKSIQNLSQKNDDESKNVAKLLGAVDLKSINTIDDFRDKILLGKGDSFGMRSTILKYLLQEKPTNITKSTREEHKILHYKYGIPTITEISNGNNQTELSNSEVGDVIKLVRPFSEPVIYTTDKKTYELYSQSPTAEMKKSGIRIELIPESAAHESYPFVLKGENVALLEEYIGGTQLFESLKSLPKKKSFYSLGRMKGDAEAGVVPSDVVTQGAPQFQKSAKPSWFDDTPGAQKINVTQDFINENPDLFDAIKNDLFLINKVKKEWEGDLKGLKKAINDFAGDGNFKLDVQQLRSAIVRIYKATPKSKANIAKTISMAESIEKMFSLFTDKPIESTKDELKKTIINNDEYNDAEKQIILGMVDDIIPENVFLFINDASPDANKNKENYYQFATNLLKSKKPSAFIHEVGHWGFYNVLTPQERLEFFKYSAERFAKGDTTLEDEQAFGRPYTATREMPGGAIETATIQTNASEDFMEYFAEQFRQYYIENKISDEQFDTLFKKISLILDKILDLFRKTSYNKELVKYFDKIIDARPKQQEVTQEAKQETGIVRVGESQGEEGENGIIKTGGEITQAAQEQEAGLPEKKKYDWEGGNERASGDEGETMVRTSTGRYVAKETMRGQQMERKKILNEAEKARQSFLKRMMISFGRGLLDSQYGVISLLKQVGRPGFLINAYLVTRNSASATAMILADKAVREIYGDLSKKKVFDINGAKLTEYELFNQLVGYQRVISIQRQMDLAYTDMINALKNGDERAYELNKKRLADNGMLSSTGEYIEFQLGQVVSSQAKALLQETRDAIGEYAFGKLMTKSKMYSDYYNSMMKSRMEAGIITQESYNYLSKFFYAPTRYISDIVTDPILSMSGSTVGIKTDAALKQKYLAGGSERLNASDYEGLLKAVTYASEYAIAENRTTNRFYNLLLDNQSNFEKNGIRIGTTYIPAPQKKTAEDAAIDGHFKAIAEGRKPNPLQLPSGQKRLVYKGMQKVITDVAIPGEPKLYTPSDDIFIDDNGNKFLIVQVPITKDEDYIKTFFNGKRHDIIVPRWFADEWYGRNVNTSSFMSKLGKYTGVNILRVIATGINPAFGVAQIVPDSISAYASVLDKKSGFLLIDYPVFVGKILLASRDIRRNSKLYQEAVKYGATTNFYNGGMVSFERGLMGKEDRSLEKVIEEWKVPGLKQYIMGSKRITETTEQMTKVALYKELKESAISKYIKETGSEPSGQILEDIKIEAAAMARGTADFHRKGTIGGNLNLVIPYLNAGTQVKRAVLRGAKDNYGKFIFAATQYAALTAVLTASAIGHFDDDDEELREAKRRAYLKLSDFDRDNRALIYYFENWENADGSKGRFLSIKIPGFLVPVHSYVRRLVERKYLENRSLDDKDIKDILFNVAETIPGLEFVNAEKEASRNPAYSFVAKVFFNKDPYRQEQVVAYEKATKDYLEGAKYNERPVGKIYQDIGKAAVGLPLLPEGISPKRLQAGVNTFPFQSNPLTGFTIFTGELIASDKKIFEDKYGKEAASIVLKASGITDRYLKEGSKINQNIIEYSNEESKERGEEKNNIATVALKKMNEIYEKNPNISSADLRNSVLNWYKETEYKKLNTEEKAIAREFFSSELKSIILSLKSSDEFVKQVVRMSGSDPKIDAIIQYIDEVATSEDSKKKFINTLVDIGISNSTDFKKRIAQRGRPLLTNGNTNPDYEPKVGYIYNQMLYHSKQK